MPEESSTSASSVVPPAPEPRIVDCIGQDRPEQAIQAAKDTIAAGRCLVMPTDTVYGICANAFEPRAVQRLLAAKQRGRDAPPPVLIGDVGVLAALAKDVPEAAKRLVEVHWPGPLTIICKAQPSLRMDLGDTRGTIALRVPDHELARDVLRRTGPLAVSSANISGQPAATDVHGAVEQLGLDVDLYLDGGPTPGPAPSTIVDFTAEPEGRIVREGILSLEQLRETVPGLRGTPGSEEAKDPGSPEAVQPEPPAETSDVPEVPSAAKTSDEEPDTR